MGRVDIPATWSMTWRNRQLWSKWRLARSSEVAELAGSVLRGTPDTYAGSDDPLLTGLSALASGEHAAAASALAGDGGCGCLVALGDVYADQGDWVRAGEYYEEAVAAAPADPVAVLGRAVARIATGRADTVLDDLRRLARAHPGEPVVTAYLALGLLCRATEARALSRDQEPVISSAGQLTECAGIVAELESLQGLDHELAAAVTTLERDVAAADGWTWRTSGTNGGVLLVTIVLSVLGVAAGVIWVDTPLLVGAALVGAIGVHLAVIGHRRPTWELRAQQAAVIRRGR